MANPVISTIRLPNIGNRADDAEAVSRLANQIVAACHGKDPSSSGGLIALPSERELSSRLRMSRHAVRNALAHLERKGLLCRPGGRGPLLVTTTAAQATRPVAATELLCINYIFNSGLDSQGLHWLKDEYLAGYTEVLEHQSCKTRYVVWGPGNENYESLLWCHAAPRRQACMVVGRRDPALLNWLREHSVPFVLQNYCLYDYHALPPHHKVYVNKAGGSFAATTRLMGLGHQRIGFVGPTPAPDRSWPEYEGFHAALRCGGLTPYPDDVVELNTEIIEQALDPCRRLLERAQRPTAVLGGSGAVTIALLQSAKALGLRVPEELSIIGFDDDKTPAYPHLSTIAVPRRAQGRQAMELLLEAAKNPDLPPQTRVVECQMNEQATVGPPQERIS